MISLQRSALADESFLRIGQGTASLLEFLLARREAGFAGLDRSLRFVCGADFESHSCDRRLVRLRLPGEFLLTFVERRFALSCACDRALQVLLGPIQLDTSSPSLVSQLGKVDRFSGDFRDELLGLTRARLKSRLVRLDGGLPLDERRFAGLQICGHRSTFLGGFLDLPFPAFDFAPESRKFVSRFGLAPFLSREGGGLRIEFLFLFRQGRRELLELPFAPREPFLRGGRSRFHALVSLSEFPRACREGLRLLFVRRLRLQDLFLPAD